MNDLLPIVFPEIAAQRPTIIAGPCSAETEEQVLATARALAADGIRIFLSLIHISEPTRL